MFYFLCFFFFKQKTAYEMRISDWSSDVCSSDLSERIAAPRDRVYRALNDPEVLKAAIPGCETIERLSDTEMTATVVTKVGPVKARFQGAVTLSELDPPNGYTISGEGKGGAAGFAGSEENTSELQSLMRNPN